MTGNARATMALAPLGPNARAITLHTAVPVTIRIGGATANACLAQTAIAKARSKLMPHMLQLMRNVAGKNFAVVSLDKVPLA